jgi:TonB-linked SusC/RagA family outer membrane protein
MQFSFAQQKTVTGTVTSDGAKLPGATVSIAGTQQGTQTDENGKFSIKASEGDVLEFSFLGKDPKTVTVGAGNVVNVVLATQTNTIEAVQIVGALGIKKRKEALTSTVQTISNKDLTAASNPDPVRGLVGKVSGVTINATTNGVNGDNSIRIRSMLSITGNTEALIVIDDVISTSSVFSSLSPESIQNVTVLKGAQGAALYGSQGKSGVVIVTTKKGSLTSDKMDVRISSSVDFENINFVPERQTKYGQGWYGGWDPQENGGWGEVMDGSIRQVGIPYPDGSFVSSPYSSKGADEIKDFYKTGVIYQNNASVGLSGKDSYFNLNLNNFRRDFIVDGDKFNRNGVLLNAGKKIGRLDLSGSINYINSRTKQANVNAATSRGDYTLLTNLLQTATNIPISEFADRGLYGWNAYYQNPYWARENNRLEEDRDFFNFGLRAEYDFTKNISFILNNSIQSTTTNQLSYANEAVTPDESDSDFNSAASFYQSSRSRLYYYGDFMFNFNYDLTDKVGLKANLGQNIQYIRNNQISQGGVNFDIDGWYNIQNVLNPDKPSALFNRRTQNNLTATFANMDLNYDDYLFLNATARYEGNSVGVRDSQFFFYPSAGLSFIPTKAFASLEDKNTLSYLKLYANYSLVGSLDPVDPYDVLSLAQVATGYPFSNSDHVSYNDEFALASTDLKPEKYKTFELGLGLGLLKDRIMIDAAYYNTKTSDLINDSTVSSTTGLTRVLSNNGELNSNGFEIDLGYQAVKTENFSWNGRLSYSTYKTEVVDAGEGQSLLVFDGGNAGADFNISAVEGENFPTIMGTDWLRDGSGNIVINSTNGRPIVDPSFKVLGQATPDYILGWTNSFQYKGFGLAFTADFRTGHSFISQTKYNLTWNGHLFDSAEVSREDGWIIPNSVYDNPATPGVVDYIPNTSVVTGGAYTTPSVAGNLTQGYWNSAAQLGSHNLIDATSLRIREIAFSYEISKKVLKNTGLTGLKFSVNARNPIVILADGDLIKAKNGMENRGYADPEASSFYNQSTSTSARRPAGTQTNTARNGVGFIGDGQYPSTRTFGFTISANF